MLKVLSQKYQVENFTKGMLKASGGSIQKALTIYEKKEIYEKVEETFNKIEELKLIDVINKLDILYKNKEDILEILDYINVILFEKAKRNIKYLTYIEAVEEAKKSIKASNNYDMTIDSLLFKIWEEKS